MGNFHVCGQMLSLLELFPTHIAYKCRKCMCMKGFQVLQHQPRVAEFLFTHSASYNCPTLVSTDMALKVEKILKFPLTVPAQQSNTTLMHDLKMIKETLFLFICFLTEPTRVLGWMIRNMPQKQRTVLKSLLTHMTLVEITLHITSCWWIYCNVLGGLWTTSCLVMTKSSCIKWTVFVWSTVIISHIALRFLVYPQQVRPCECSWAVAAGEWFVLRMFPECSRTNQGHIKSCQAESAVIRPGSCFQRNHWHRGLQKISKYIGTLPETTWKKQKTYVYQNTEEGG